eukprot:12485488-Ditylum_brightwellii.AAC.1
MKDNVENLSQLKDNDLEEVCLKEADLKEVNTKKAIGHKNGDDSFPCKTFDEDKTVHESQSSADKDKNCTALKKVSLRVHSGGSNHVVNKCGSEICSVSRPIGLPNSENKYNMNADKGDIDQMGRTCSGVENQSTCGVGSKKDTVDNKLIEREVIHEDSMNLIKSESN